MDKPPQGSGNTKEEKDESKRNRCIDVPGNIDWDQVKASGKVDFALIRRDTETT